MGRGDEVSETGRYQLARRLTAEAASKPDHAKREILAARFFEIPAEAVVDAAKVQ